MEYLILFIIIAIGTTLVIKTEWFYSFMGPIEWAEAHLGTEGGTRIFIKLIGIILILGSFLWITGGLQAILTGIFRPLGNSLS